VKFWLSLLLDLYITGPLHLCYQFSLHALPHLAVAIGTFEPAPATS
jgi:hypothetical protein